jgi:hypothetical protein
MKPNISCQEDCGFFFGERHRPVNFLDEGNLESYGVDFIMGNNQQCYGCSMKTDIDWIESKIIKQ